MRVSALRAGRGPRSDPSSWCANRGRWAPEGLARGGLETCVKRHNLNPVAGQEHQSLWRGPAIVPNGFSGSNFAGPAAA
jgi:hypothetical protein